MSCRSATVTDTAISSDLHPYYKLEYIEQRWGGEAEYLEDLADGVTNARNWQAYAREVIEAAVSVPTGHERF